MSTTSTPAAPSLLPHLWKSAAVSGVLAVVVGIAVLAWPGISIAIAAIFFGVSLLVNGVQQVFFAFSLEVSAGGRVLLFISGAASLILAVLAIRHLYDAVLLLAIWIGVGFIFRGVATTISAISDPSLPGRGWNIFVGAVSLIAGVVIMASPFESIRTLALVVGIWLVVLGVMEVVAAFAIRRVTTQTTAGGDAITHESIEPVPTGPVTETAKTPAPEPTETSEPAEPTKPTESTKPTEPEPPKSEESSARYQL